MPNRLITPDEAAKGLLEDCHKAAEKFGIKPEDAAFVLASMLGAPMAKPRGFEKRLRRAIIPV